MKAKDFLLGYGLAVAVAIIALLFAAYSNWLTASFGGEPNQLPPWPALLLTVLPVIIIIGGVNSWLLSLRRRSGGE